MSSRLTAAQVGILRSGQNRPQVIAGVAALVLGEITVVEVQVAHESAVIKCRPVRGALPPPISVQRPEPLKSSICVRIKRMGLASRAPMAQPKGSKTRILICWRDVSERASYDERTTKSANWSESVMFIAFRLIYRSSVSAFFDSHQGRSKEALHCVSQSSITLLYQSLYRPEARNCHCFKQN